MIIKNILPKIALILIILAPMVLNIFLIGDEIFKFNYDKKDSITLVDERFKELKNILPSKGIVGYISDIEEDMNEESKSQKTSLGPYYLTQYALSPLIIDYSPNHVYVIGNFLTKAYENSTFEKFKQNFFVINDFGNGVVLFKRKD